jgi:hypothetical protein
MAFSEVKTKGMRKVLHRIETIEGAPTYSIQIGQKATTHKYYRSADKGANKSRVRRTIAETETRSEVKNVVILRTQAKEGRNIVYLKPAEKKILDKIISNAIHKINSKSDLKPFEKAVKEVGKMVIKFYKAHIARNQGFRGPLRPNTESTINRKIRRMSPGKVDQSLRSKLTPLIETGALKDSFQFEVKRRR